MKIKLLAITLFVCLFASAQSVTPTVGLQVPAINSLGWGTATNGNWSLIDSLLAGSQKYPTGVFTQSTDPAGSCSVTYQVISTATPSMPTHWACSGGVWVKSALPNLPLNAANGVPQLDSSAHIPPAQVNFNLGVTGSVDRTQQDHSRDTVNFKDFGAKCDGSTIDTASIQAAINYMSSKGITLNGTSGTCIIDAPIMIPFGVGWRLLGAAMGTPGAGTVIQQNTDNTPIFEFTTSGTWGWTIGYFQFQWKNNQPKTNTLAVAIYENPTQGVGSNIFEWTITHLHLINGYRGIDVAYQSSGYGFANQGYTVDNILAEPTMSGATIHLTAAGSLGGQALPRCHISNIWNRQGISEPVITMQYCAPGLVENIESNNGINELYDFGSNYGLVVNGTHAELWTIDTPGIAMMNLDNTWGVVNGAGETATMDIGAGNRAYVFRSINGSGGLVINGLFDSSLPTSGKLGILQATGGPTAQYTINSYHVSDPVNVVPFFSDESSATTGAIASVDSQRFINPIAASTSSANSNSQPLTWNASYWDGTASRLDKWTAAVVPGAGTNPASVFTFSHLGGTSGATSYSFDKPVAVTGDVTLPLTNTIWTSTSKDTGITEDSSGNLSYKIAGVAPRAHKFYYGTSSVVLVVGRGSSVGSGVSGNTDLHGRLTMSSGSATYTFLGTYATRPDCFAQDVTTPANTVTPTETTTTVTFAGTGSDVIKYFCFGYN